jgi:hypothetical protein
MVNPMNAASAGETTPSLMLAQYLSNTPLIIINIGELVFVQLENRLSWNVARFMVEAPNLLCFFSEHVG